MSDLTRWVGKQKRYLAKLKPDGLMRWRQMRRRLQKMPPIVPALAAAGLGLLAVQQVVRRRRRMDFRDKVVVVTGGSRGLGLVLAREFAAEGARVAILARDAAELERARAELAGRGAGVLALACDIRALARVEDAVRQIVERFGRIDVLVNNAGVIQVGPVEHMTLQDFQSALDVHVWGMLYVTLAALPHLPRPGGRIVNVTSIGGKVAVPHLLPYTMSKYAAVGLSDGLRAELVDKGIYVTTVCPGLMRTGSHVNAFFKGRQPGEFTWFSVLSALPLASTGVRRAARQIVQACRYGEPILYITPQARYAALAGELVPGLMARAMAVFNRLLPPPTTADGDRLKSGWESASRWSPSPLTYLADQAVPETNSMGGNPLPP